LYVCVVVYAAFQANKVVYISRTVEAKNFKFVKQTVGSEF